MTAIDEARALVAKHPLEWRAMEDGWRARELLAAQIEERNCPSCDNYVAALDQDDPVAWLNEQSQHETDARVLAEARAAEWEQLAQSHMQRIAKLEAVAREARSLMETMAERDALPSEVAALCGRLSAMEEP